MKLRAYQNECLEFLSLSEASRMMCVLPTGAGKTVIFASHAIRHGYKTLVLAHRRELIDQTVSTFQRVAPDIDIGVVMADRNETDNQITVASVQTLSRNERLGKLPTDYDLIVIDEAHHTIALSYLRILHRFGLIHLSQELSHIPLLQSVSRADRRLLGVTATPVRSDEWQEYEKQSPEKFLNKSSLNKVYDEITYSISIAAMIPDFLSDFRVQSVKTDISLDSVRTQSGELSSADLRDVFQESGFASELPKIVHSQMQDRDHILAFFPDVLTTENACFALNQAGIDSEFVVGAMPKQERSAILSNFADGKFRVLCNCMILTEGYDCPNIDGILLARPTKSGALIQQMVGRGFRNAPGKRDCLIVDIGFKRRKKDIVSVAGSGIFGGFMDLHAEFPTLSLEELREMQLKYKQVESLLAVLRSRKDVLSDFEDSIGADEFDVESDEPIAIYHNFIDTRLLRNLLPSHISIKDFWELLSMQIGEDSKKYWYAKAQTEVATDKQISLLQDNGIEFENVDLTHCSKGAASSLISVLLEMLPPPESWRELPVTSKQYGWLKWKGLPIPDSKYEASEMISDAQGRV